MRSPPTLLLSALETHSGDRLRHCFKRMMLHDATALLTCLRTGPFPPITAPPHWPTLRLAPGVEGEYQRAISRMGRAALGVFRSTPLTRSRRCGKRSHAGQGLLNQRQARSTQRLYARLEDGQGPEEIFTRDGAALASCLRAAAPLYPGDTLEAQERSSRRYFPGQVAVCGRAEALRAAQEWRR